jgi:hypothetical protein
LSFVFLQAENKTEFLISNNKYFTVYYHQNQLSFVSKLVLEGDSFIKRFCNETELQKPKKPIKVYLDPKIPGENEAFPVPNWIQGFYNPKTKIIVIKTNKEYSVWRENTFLTVFKHEIVHAIVDSNHYSIPRWFDEGLATSFSKGFTISDGRALLSVNKKTLINFLDEKYFNNKTNAHIAYPLACGIVSYLRETGNTNISRILTLTKQYDLYTAFSSTMGIPFDTFFDIFKEDFLSKYTVASLLISEQGFYALMVLLAIYAIFKKRFNYKKRLKEMEEQEKVEEEYLQ